MVSFISNICTSSNFTMEKLLSSVRISYVTVLAHPQPKKQDRSYRVRSIYESGLKCSYYLLNGTCSLIGHLFALFHSVRSTTCKHCKHRSTSTSREASQASKQIHNLDNEGQRSPLFSLPMLAQTPAPLEAENTDRRRRGRK